MKVFCGWCGSEINYQQKPGNEPSRQICPSCNEISGDRMPRPFSVRQKAVAVAALLGWLLMAGWAGECDRQDALAYQQVHGEIVASAATWAVGR